MIPNYLNISLVVALGALVRAKHLSIFNVIFVLFSLATISLLGARGPFLFFIIVSLFSFKTWSNHVRDPLLKILGKFTGFVAILACVYTILIWQGSSTLISRFATFSEYEDPLTAVGRDEIVNTAIYVIEDNWLWGTGLGGYGLAGYGLDANIYPHNLIIEAFAEAGIVGVLIFLISMVAILILVYTNLHLPDMLLYGTLFLFVSLNYMKSGGFVGARDFYLFMGLVISYTNRLKGMAQ